MPRDRIMSWQSGIAESGRKAQERARQRSLWWVAFDPPLPAGIFAEGDDQHVMNRELYAMRFPVRPSATDRDGCAWYPLDSVEFLVVEEGDMPAIMRCVRLSGIHGHYRKAGTEKQYKF